MLARPTSLRRKKQSGEECGDSWERLQAADLTGDQPAAQNTMGAEVSGSLRRTPSRPPRSALGLDGVGAPRLAPAARLVSRAVSAGGRSNLRDCVVPIAISRRKEAASSGQIFDTLTKAENLQGAFAGGGKGLARALRGPRSRKFVAFSWLFRLPLTSPEYLHSAVNCRPCILHP